MKEKLLAVGLLIGIITMIIGVFTFYLFQESIGGILSISDAMLIIVSLLVAGAATWIVVDRFRNIKAGLPVTDERAKDLFNKASYYAYLTAIWIGVGFVMFEDIIAPFVGKEHLTSGDIVGALVMISAIVLFGSYFFLSRKGNIE